MDTETKIQMQILFHDAIICMPKEERIARWNKFSNEEKMVLLKNMNNSWLMEAFGLTRYQLDKVKEELDFKRQQLIAQANDHIKNNFLFSDLQRLASGITHFIFRNGPIEDMHADKNKNILNEDMKVLNKYMMSHLTTILYLLKSERYFDLAKVLENHMNCGQDWDKVEQQEINELISNAIFPQIKDLFY